MPLIEGDFLLGARADFLYGEFKSNTFGVAACGQLPS